MTVPRVYRNAETKEDTEMTNQEIIEAGCQAGYRDAVAWIEKVAGATGYNEACGSHLEEDAAQLLWADAYDAGYHEALKDLAGAA